jgi:hypothetical protein
MVLMTFNEILTYLCDNFDELISPKKMARTNTNIIYLILKAIAKGYEVINNVCVVLSNKFDPAKCSEEDLNSVASLVGTERISGSASGLAIKAINETDAPLTLLTGIYTYSLDDNTVFTFEITRDTEIPAESDKTFIAMSNEIGSYPVTEQSTITVESAQAIPSDLKFSCLDNSGMLGSEPESNLAFRKRILNGVDNQDTIVELENTLRNLPYFFDCRVKYNDTLNAVEYDGLVIPPFSVAIFYSGSPRSEVGGLIANKIICPSVQTEDSTAVDYESDTFINGKHTFYLIPFKKTNFSVSVIYAINDAFTNANTVESEIRKKLKDTFTTEVHLNYIREDDIYNTIEAMNIAGINILSVNLMVNGEMVNYVSIPVSRTPELGEVNFTREEV